MLLIGLIISACGGQVRLPPEVERAFYEQVINNPAEDIGCAQYHRDCEWMEVQHVFAAHIPLSVQAQGVQAGWCIQYKVSVRHPINGDYERYTWIAFIKQTPQGYTAQPLYGEGYLDPNESMIRIC